MTRPTPSTGDAGPVGGRPARRRLRAVAGRIREDDIAEVREKARIDEVVSDYVTLKQRRRRLAEGPVPLPRREVAVVQRQPVRGVLPLLRLRRRRRRHRLPDEDRRPGVRRGGRAAGRQVRRRSCATRGGRRPPDERATRPARARLIEAHKVAQEFYAEQLATPDARAGPAVPHRARLRPGGRRDVRRRVRARATATRCFKHLRQKGFSRRGAGRRRAGRRRAARPLRPVPRPAAVADPRGQRRHDRLRRPADLRRRPDRGEVPQHPRDPDLQEEPGALRHRPGPPRHRPRRRRPSSSRATPT